MALTDVAIRGAKAKDKPYKLGDADGLFLLVQHSGGKLWRFKYRWLGKEKKLTIGKYPEVSLSEARKRRDEARKLLAAGKNPGKRRSARNCAPSSRTPIRSRRSPPSIATSASGMASGLGHLPRPSAANICCPC
jgi:hypothetical protein